jgi:hypothetical protein
MFGYMADRKIIASFAWPQYVVVAPKLKRSAILPE